MCCRLLEIASKADNKEDDKDSPVHQLPEPGLHQGTSAHSFETDQLQQVSSPAPAETCPVLLALVIGLLMPLNAAQSSQYFVVSAS